MLKKPTFFREFRSILHCQKHHIPCLDVAFYAERKNSGNGPLNSDYQAILITPALNNYIPFSEVISQWEGLEEPIRHQYLEKIAHLTASLHRNRLSHNGLYPKHLFVNLDADPAIKMIDMERMSFQFRKTRKTVSELETFVRRAGVFSDDEVEFFLNRYCHYHPGDLKLGKLKKLFFARVNSKMARKNA